MILRINPNRMELLRLRRRLLLARRGHKLLQDKLEEMMRRFLLLLKDIFTAEDDFQERNRQMLQRLLYCRINSSGPDFEEILSRINVKFTIGISTMRVMNVKTPVFEVRDLNINRQYDFFKTPAQMDLAVAGAGDYLGSLLKLARLLKTLDILSYEIERTRRRVNALGYILIPSAEDTIRYITQKLNEFERGNLVRLMRVKEIVRAH